MVEVLERRAREPTGPIEAPRTFAGPGCSPADRCERVQRVQRWWPRLSRVPLEHDLFLAYSFTDSLALQVDEPLVAGARAIEAQGIEDSSVTHAQVTEVRAKGAQVTTAQVTDAQAKETQGAEDSSVIQAQVTEAPANGAQGAEDSSAVEPRSFEDTATPRKLEIDRSREDGAAKAEVQPNKVEAKLSEGKVGAPAQRIKFEIVVQPPADHGPLEKQDPTDLELKRGELEGRELVLEAVVLPSRLKELLEPKKGSRETSETGERNVAERRHGRPCGQQPVDEVDGHRPQGEEAPRLGIRRCRFRGSGICDHWQQRSDAQSVSADNFYYISLFSTIYRDSMY
ncbi:uncharacterized protein LOC143212367 [Lasioglossum baleicum]|uniref:uncharacterized protein LOC143212367 n=1 Tax=Lasioglossum baleicum TaxID=434251 RepID=UPI003FCEA8A8